MHLYICVDDRGGLRFNHRRQSRDSAVSSDILHCTNGAALYMTAYSRKLFSESATNIVCTDEPAAIAAAGEHCFAESLPLSPFLEKFETISIYRWNRVYPSDERLDFDPSQTGFQLKSTVDFPGTSHEIITKEVYTR